MTPAAPNLAPPGALLAKLLAEPESRRAALLHSLGPVPRDILLPAADQAEQLVISDLRAALDATAALVTLSDQVHCPASGARTRRAHAQALAYANRFEEALTVLSRAVELALQAGDELEAARARMTSMHALARQCRYDEAIAAGEAAREAFVNAREPVLAARADINLGGAHRLRGNAAASITYFQRAKPALTDHPLLLAPLASNLAEALLDLDRFDDARAAFHEALLAFERGGAGRAAAIVEGNLADLSSRQGRLDEALRHFERARRRLGDTEAPGDMARLKVEQAETLSALGMRSEAIDMYLQAVPVLRERNMGWETARALTGLARVLLRSGRAHDASVNLAHAAAVFETLGHSLGTARVRMTQAEILSAAGDDAGAHAMLLAARTLLKDSPAEAAIVCLQLSAIALRAGRLHDAATEIEQGLAASRGLDLPSLTAELLHARAQLHATQHRPGDAAADLRAAIVEIERVRGALQADRFRAAFLGDHASIYQDCASALLDEGGPLAAADAFEVTERCKSRSLLDMLHGGVGLSGFTPPSPDTSGTSADAAEQLLLDQLVQRRGEMNALYARLDGMLSPAARPGDRGQWSASIKEREREIAALERRLASTRRYADVFSQPARLEHIQSLLSPDAALIEYFPEAHDLSAMVVTAHAVTLHRRLAPLDEVVDRIQGASFQISRAIARSHADGPAAQRMHHAVTSEFEALARLVHAPLAPDLKETHQLIIVPHGPLHALAFGVLRHHGRWLLQDHLIAQVPSASVLARLALPRAAPASSKALVVGVGDALAPQAEEEARHIAAALPGADLLAGPHATVQQVMHRARGIGLLHIASHARFVPGDPLASGIKLADGWLTARDIYHLSLDGAVVTLSGCDTGRSAIGSADELTGLVRAFLAAGTSALLIALWPLHDRWALEVMSQAYRREEASSHSGYNHLVSSVREAQLSLMGHAPHPAMWAPFTWIGMP